MWRGWFHPTQPTTVVQNSGMARLRRFIVRVTLSRSPSGRPAKFGIDLVEESRVADFIDIECYSMASHDLDCVSAIASRSPSRNCNSLLPTDAIAGYFRPGYNGLSKITKVYEGGYVRLILEETSRHFWRLIIRLAKHMRTCNLVEQAHAIEIH